MKFTQEFLSLQLDCSQYQNVNIKTKNLQLIFRNSIIKSLVISQLYKIVKYQHKMMILLRILRQFCTEFL
ncbi:hypothetical protein C9426_14270 [Serratia sp. S1B]|nr:hypothetical protein C9426_14270 [Serratia sp. S1B]